MFKTCLAVFLFSLTLSFQAEAHRSFVVVTIDGADPLGVKRSRELGVHALVPTNRRILQKYRLHHGGDQAYHQVLLSHFECERGKQGRSGLDLVIVAFSWGSNRAFKLAHQYQELCGRQVSAFYLIDGVRKPLGPFKKDVPTDYCVNFFQRLGPVRGAAIPGCVNFDYTPVCRDFDLGGIPCHLLTGRAAPDLIIEDLRHQFGIGLRRLIPVTYPDPVIVSDQS